MISVCSVAYHSPDWWELQKKSLSLCTEGEFEHVVVDNSGENKGHGAGLDDAIAKSNGEYVLVLDIDAHVLLPGWDREIVEYFNKDKFDLLAGRGGALKPVRPCLMFFRREWFLDGKYSFRARRIDDLTLDVGVHFGMLAMQEGQSVGYVESRKPIIYPETWGEEYVLFGRPFVYHHWYGTRWHGGHTVIDGRCHEDFLKSKAKVFARHESGGADADVQRGGDGGSGTEKLAREDSETFGPTY